MTSRTLRQIAVELGDDWPGALTDVVVTVTAELGHAEVGQRLAVVVLSPPAEPERAAALTESLRSLVHAAVLERRANVNLLIGGTEADRARTLDYLADADFVVGATIDLGAAS